MQDSNSSAARPLSAAHLSTPLTAQLKALPPVRARAIIINCNTKMVSTLALMSALRYAGMPVLLIDCESTDGSQDWFRGLAAQHEFDLAFAPLRPHGETLDQIFAASRDESILLIDSDLEILQDDLMPKLRAEMTATDCYGAGFLHADRALTLGPPTATALGRYADRMWIPLCFLKTAPVRDALNAGATFMHSRDYLEFPWSMSLSRWLYARHRIPLLRRVSLEGFAAARERIHGERAAFREYDTGARIHESLVGHGRHLAHLGEPYWSRSVRHYHGVTRATLSQGQGNATAPGAILAEVAERLLAGYGMVVS
jgi:glycosyltransferase involved in cell wall biosynthesis